MNTAREGDNIQRSRQRIYRHTQKHSHPHAQTQTANLLNRILNSPQCGIVIPFVRSLGGKFSSVERSVPFTCGTKRKLFHFIIYHLKFEFFAEMNKIENHSIFLKLKNHLKRLIEVTSQSICTKLTTDFGCCIFGGNKC